MDDYIKRNDLLEDIEHSVVFTVRPDVPSAELRGARKIIDRIRSAPAADVAEVRHGRWVLTTQPLGWRDEDCAECSECGEDFVLDEWGIDDVKDAMRYCPSCGAKMDGGEDDEVD